MAVHDDTESCSSSRAEGVESSPMPAVALSRNHQLLKQQVYNDILQRFHDSGFEDAMLPAFRHRLWTHFNRLPQRYALDVNVERAEDVLTHMRLLREAETDPQSTVAYHVRLVHVNPATNEDDAGGSVHSYSSLYEGSEGSVKNSLHPGLSLSLHPPPTFCSAQNLQALGFQPRVEDRDNCLNNTSSHSSRTMHEITFSTADKPKLLTQLTSLLSELSLNIQEAHAFSTLDGFSLDVFVVDGWPHEETEQFRQLLDEEIRKIKAPQSKGLSMAASGDHHHESLKYLHKNVVAMPRKDNDAEIDQSLLEIGCKVAFGSYGDLHRGTYRGQEVAIKILRPGCANADLLKEFFQEVNIMRKIQHKNVVQFIGACTKPPSLCIVTEFMSKGNLYDYIHKRRTPLNYQTIIRVAIDISTGMEYLHQNNIIHRDLKTANLLIDENGVIKVADFGVARVQMHTGLMTAETGTYRWMAPEVIGHKPYNHKADVFSFGIVMWELLTGELPYSYLTPLQAALGVVQKGLRPGIPKNTHSRLADLLERCWHQNPQLRPDFSEIVGILQQFATEASVAVD